MRVVEGQPELPPRPPKVAVGPYGVPIATPTPVPPFWGEWGVVRQGSGGHMRACGRVGPFKTIQEAFSEAGKAAHAHGAELLPRDGYAQVKDSVGQSVGPIT